MRERAPLRLLSVALSAALAGTLVLAQEKPLAQRGTLRVLVSTDDAPELFDITGKAAEPGMEREMLEGFCRLRGLKLQVIPIDFEKAFAALQRGEGDLVNGVIDTESRRKQMAFTVEVLPTRHVVVSRKPQPVVQTLEQFRAARVAVLKGTSWEEATRAAGVPAGRSEDFTDQNAALDCLRSGKCTAMVMSVSDYTAARRRDPALQAGLFLGQPGVTAFALRREDTELKQALDEYITGLRRTASWSRLVVKYFGEDALAVLGRARKE